MKSRKLLPPARRISVAKLDKEGSRINRSKNPTGMQLLDEACRKWPSLPSRTLARMLFAKHPGVWPNLNAARNGVLYRRGRGRKPGDRRCGPGYGSTPSPAPRVPHRPDVFLPPSEEKSFLPFIVNVKRDTRVLVLNDIHVPYHNVPAVQAALEEGRRQKCGIVILNGDTLDFYALSRFQKDPRARSAKVELERARQLLDAIDDLFPKARKIWKDGNHDERYGHYLQANAPELFEVLAEHASLDRLLDLPGRGWEYVTDRRPIHLGNLALIHGHEYPTPVLGPVNAARGLFLRAKDCSMVGHHHQTSEHTETSIREKMITTWSIGCLCDLHPYYARFNKWNHGAATVGLRPDGAFDVHNFRIHEGRVMNSRAA